MTYESGDSDTPQVEWSDFYRVEMHVGTIIKAEFFKRARNPAYKLHIDFGAKLGVKKSSAQITETYQENDVIGRQIIAVTNFRPKNIAGFTSEVLVLGLVLADNRVILLSPERTAPNGLRVA